MDVERLGKDEVGGILNGTCHIFPKLDGTNSSVWVEDGKLMAGSRNRELSAERDNHGFYKYVQDNADLFWGFFAAFPHAHLFGEFLVPHTLKTYREDAWGKFYIFDVYNVDSFWEMEDIRVLEKFGLNFISPLGIVFNPAIDDLHRYLNSNTYLVQDGQGVGEGIVIKNYEFRNKYGRQVWAKLVRNEFKEMNSKTFYKPGTVSQGSFQHEVELANSAVTPGRLEKLKAKLEPWDNKRIPQFLSTLYYEVVQEELWDYLKKARNPVIDFKKLNQLVLSLGKKFLGLGA